MKMSTGKGTTTTICRPQPARGTDRTTTRRGIDREAEQTALHEAQDLLRWRDLRGDMARPEHRETTLRLIGHYLPLTAPQELERILDLLQPAARRAWAHERTIFEDCE